MIIDRIALLLLIVGGLNWGSIGLFQFDLVAWIFGGSQAALGSRIIYIAVAIPLTYILDTNYCNFLESALEELEEYRAANGQLAYTAVISIFLTLGAMVGSFIYYIVHKILTVLGYCVGIKPLKD